MTDAEFESLIHIRLSNSVSGQLGVDLTEDWMRFHNEPSLDAFGHFNYI